jgi:hypothetical protein
MATHARAPHFRRARPGDIAAMSAIRLAVTENVLSDHGKVTLQMYRDYMDMLGRARPAQQCRVYYALVKVV